MEPHGTPFQVEVWRELRRIPPGTTRGYAQLASAIGRPAAVRAVGAANGANPIALFVPCHRVIAANGTLWGYGGGTGTQALAAGARGRAVRRSAGPGRARVRGVPFGARARPLNDRGRQRHGGVLQRTRPPADDASMSETPVTPYPEWTMPLPRAVASALPDVALSVVCLAVWIAPTAFSPDLPRWIMLTMLLEFVVIHSSAFMGQVLFADGAAGKRAMAVLGLGGFYTLFVGGFALTFHTAWPLVSFWLLTLNRMASVLFRPTPGAGQRPYLNATWAAHVLCYLLGAFATIFPAVPRLGFTPGFVASLRLPGSGLWISQPWRVVAFGAIYFAAVAALEWTDYRALLPRPKPSPPR